MRVTLEITIIYVYISFQFCVVVKLEVFLQKSVFVPRHSQFNYESDESFFDDNTT